MSTERFSLRELLAQRTGCLTEQEAWCLLSEGALALSHVLQIDPGSWVGGPSLLISPDTFLIGPEGVQFCQGAYSSDAEELNLFLAPEVLTYQRDSVGRQEVEKTYIFSLGMCITASAMLPQEEGLLLKFRDDSLRELLMRMGEEDPARRDVTLQDITDMYAAYRERTGVSLRLGALLAGGEAVTAGLDESVEFGIPEGREDNSQSLARELDEAHVTPAAPSSPPPSPSPRLPSAALQRVNSLDSLYRHIPIQERPSREQKRARLSGMYSRHISASYDDVSHTSLQQPIPGVGLETDTSLLLGVQSGAAIERPLSTDSTGIPRNLSSAKAYTGSSCSSSSSEAVQEQLVESESSTLSETEWDEERQQEEYSHRSDTLIKFTEQELHSDLHQETLPPLTTPDTFVNGAEESPPLTPTNQLTQDTPLFFSNGTDMDPIPPLVAPVSVGENEQESPSTSSDLRERALPSPPSRLSQLSSSPSRSEDSPLLRGEDRGRSKKSETDLLTLSQALEAGVGLPADGHSGTESGDELTPTAIRKKRGVRRRMSDQEVYVFEPTYDEEWQTLENREESMIKLRKLLGPDFQRLTGVSVPDKTLDTSDHSATPPIHTHRRDVEVILLNSRTFVANVDETSLVLDLFQQVVAFLSLQEPENFSLAIIDKEEVFLDPDLPLYKYSPRGWSERQLDSHRHVRGRIRGRERRFSVYFRVKFFVENVRLLKSRQTRHLYYLQLKRDLLEGRVSCEEEPALALAGLSLQIELGDYRPEVDGESYYLPQDYLHERVLDSLPAETISDTLRQLHLSQQGLSRTEAELSYLKQAQKLPEYGIVYNKLVWQKKQSYEQVWAGISTRGFVLSKMGDSEKVPLLSFSWKLIKLMWHRNKKFVIQPQVITTPSLASSELILLTDSYKQSKYLLKLSRQFHTYQILTRMRVATGAFKGLFDDSSTLNLTESISFYSSKGSLSTLHSGKSDPYLPPADTEIDLAPLPTGIDIPEEPGLKLMSVSLKQVPGFGFGLTVILNPPERSPGLYIQNIAINGPAHLDGKLKLFDQIMSVNGKPITGNTYKDVLSMLQTSQEIEMIAKTSCEVEDGVFRMETPVIVKRMFVKSEEEFEVTLKRDAAEDFGFTVEDRYNENGELCVAVREITNRDLAGMLVTGDRILEVNSVRLVSLKSAEINTLMEAFTDIHIRLQRDKPSPEKPAEEVFVQERATPLSQQKTAGANYTSVALSKSRKYSPKRGPPSPPPVPPATREKFMEPDYVEFETELCKINGSLGLNINILARQSGFPVYITRVVSGSSAEQTGLIEAGDQIVSIDSNLLTDMGVEELVDFLASLPDDQMLLFKLRREVHLPAEFIEDLRKERAEQDDTLWSTPTSLLAVPQAEESIDLFERKLPDPFSLPKSNLLPLEQTLTVMILKDAAGSLGIRLHSMKESDESTGIYIKEILKGSPASRAAELHAGAKIISINNQSLVGLDRQKAVSILKKAANPILLDIIPDPLMVASELSLTGPMRSGLTPPLKHVDTKSTLSHESLPGRSISTQELMAVLDSPNVREEHFTVTLQRGERGLGLKVISKQVDQTGLLVKSILGDPAQSNGQLMRGDEITAIDGVNIQSMKRGEVLTLIKGDPGTSIVLHMKRYIRIESPTDRQVSLESDGREDTHRPEDLPASLLFTQLSTNSYSRPLPHHNCIEHVFELNLSRGSDQKLGIHIGSLPPDQFPSGIFVKKLTDNSVASTDGRLSVDDILLEANGTDLRNLTKEEALDALKQSTGDIKFLVARYTPYNVSSDEQGVEVESSIELPPLPDTAPPAIPLPSQHLDISLLLDQSHSLSTDTDTIVLTQSLDATRQSDQSLPPLEPLDSMGALSPDLLHPSLPSSDLYPNRDFPINPYQQHKGIQESTLRLVEPYTQLDFELYPIEELHAEMQRINAEMEPESVENDFKEVRARKPEIAASVAKTDSNSRRNRSLRAIPYDTNRVVLNSTDPVDDYINASLVQIKVNDLEFKYVCAQAPIPSEVGRFWQMVWELELYVIIMLVELKEFGIRRTPPYWDESENTELKPEDQMEFGHFSVMMTEENYTTKMTMRGIYLTNKTTGEKRHILQFNYKQWSGTGIPKSVPDLCNFIDYIRERVGVKEMLIHCSVGIGRTGSFCLVDILSKLVKNRVKADVFQLVLTLNSSRMNLIQTNEQYKVGYSALVHLLFERNP